MQIVSSYKCDNASFFLSVNDHYLESRSQEASVVPQVNKELKIQSTNVWTLLLENCFCFLQRRDAPFKELESSSRMLSSSMECTSHGVLGILNIMFPLAFVVSISR